MAPPGISSTRGERRDDSVVHADWEWHGHVALWSCPFEEAGQYVAVKVNESEGGGLPWRTLSTT